MRKLSRRGTMLGGAAIIGAAAIGTIFAEMPRFFRHKVGGPYADLVNRLVEPDRAALLGKAVLAEHGTFDAKAVARSLRGRLATRALTDSANADIAAGRLSEAGGWLIPETLALICALAAKSV